MSGFYKECAVLRDLNGKPLFVLDLVECLDKEQYVALKKEANENYLKQKTDFETNIEDFKKAQENEIQTFKNATNEKLSDYHKILQTLTKEK